MVLSSPFFIYAKSNGDSDTHKIEIVKPVTLTSEVEKMAESDNSSNGGNSGSSGTQSTTPAQQPAAPAQTQSKPSGPPNITFKGSVDTTVGKTMNNPTDSSSDNGGG